MITASVMKGLINSLLFTLSITSGLRFYILKLILICVALRDLVLFVHLKNVKNTHGGVFLFSTPAWVFFTFLNGANGTKSRKMPHMLKSRLLVVVSSHNVNG